MAEADPNKRPIIIKKIKKTGGGHHGGAWKVAYADFVTAMMAFFLLLWLLASSSKATLEGIAEYFTPTTGIKDSQGIGFKGGLSDAISGTARSNMAMPGVVVGRAPSGAVADNPERPSPTDSNMDDNLFAKGASALTQSIHEEQALQAYQANIGVEQTSEGLRVTISDSDKYPMFEPGKPQLSAHGEAVLGAMAALLERMPNYMTIIGHTDASPIEAGTKDYSAWELSSDRAQAARRYLVRAGLGADRFKRVIGMADRELLVPSEPRSPRNRRIALIMLRGHMLIPDTAVPATEAPAAPAAEPVAEAPAPAAEATPDHGAALAP